MLNYFYCYSVIWSAIIFLYYLGWSDFNSPLNPALLTFFVITIILSFLLGFFLRNSFRYKRVSFDKSRKPYITILIVVGFLLDFAFGGEVPLLSIGIARTSIYKEFAGIPIIHVVLVAGGMFYVCYLFYRFLCTKDKPLLIEIAAVSAMFLLLFSRNALMLIGFVCLLILLADLKYQSKKIKGKQIILIVIGVLIVLYLFGVLGNIRSGYAWNETWYIRAVGFFNDKYPAFLSEQFMWAYSYITSPLANLNYNIDLNNVHLDSVNYLLTFLPETLAKRVPDYSVVNTMLLYDPLNASTGFIEPHYFGGILGLYGCFLGQSAIMGLAMYFKKDECGSVLLYAVCCEMTILNFFFNSFMFSGLFWMFFIAVIFRLKKKECFTSSTISNSRGNINEA